MYKDKNHTSINKIITMILIVSLMMFLFTGCGGSADTDHNSDATSDTGSSQSDDKIRIGISLGTMREERWQREADMFKEYAKELGVEVLIQSAEDVPSKQIDQCENFISQGVDVLIVQALDSEAAGVICDPAKDAGIPVIAYDRFVRNGELDYYVTFDSVKVGEIQAQFVVERAPRGNYIRQKGGPEDFNAHLVYQGHKNILQPLIDKGDINIVLEQWCNGWDPNEALKHTENGLTLVDNNIQAVIASNDATAGAAIQALAAQGLAGKVPIAGQDADLAACQRIVEGLQTGTVYKPLRKLNKAAMDLAYALATNQDPMKVMDSSLGTWTKLNNGVKDVDSFSVDVIAVDKDNIVYVIIKDGFHKLEDVYKNIPKDQWPQI